MAKEEYIFHFTCPLCMDVFIAFVDPKDIKEENDKIHVPTLCPMCHEKITYTLQKEGEVNATE